MRLRHKKGAETNILTSPFVINVDTNEVAVTNAFHMGEHAPERFFRAKRRKCDKALLGCEPDAKNFPANQLTSEYIFGNNNPLHLELGMGKGKFIIELSKQNPNINYIGIEKSATIVLKAIDSYLKINDYSMGELCEPSSKCDNLRFICADIKNLENIFLPHSIDKIYLNFSDPWPKKRHESRRLTHNKFLSTYEKILKPNSLLEFKTDNKELFDFSLEEIKNSNFKLLDFTYDLHSDEKLNKNNIMTEYEAKFSRLGNKICKLIARI